MRAIIKLAHRENTDPIDTLDALLQIQHINAALALIKSTVSNNFQFLLPCYLDKENRVYWCAFGIAGNVDFITTKFETKLAGAQASISMTKSLGAHIAEKNILNALKEIKDKQIPEEFNDTYWDWAENADIESPLDPFEMLERILRKW